jgi:hypothetical protein
LTWATKHKGGWRILLLLLLLLLAVQWPSCIIRCSLGCRCRWQLLGLCRPLLRMAACLLLLLRRRWQAFCLG